MARVELVWSPQPGDVQQRWLDVEEGSTLESALRGCADFMAAQAQPLGQLRVGIWGRMRPLSTPLRERDRIEVYRPLTVDPKEDGCVMPSAANASCHGTGRDRAASRAPTCTRW